MMMPSPALLVQIGRNSQIQPPSGQTVRNQLPIGTGGGQVMAQLQLMLQSEHGTPDSLVGVGVGIGVAPITHVPGTSGTPSY